MKDRAINWAASVLAGLFMAGVAALLDAPAWAMFLAFLITFRTSRLHDAYRDQS